MADTLDAQTWRVRWDRQQNAHEPAREESFGVMLDVVEAVAGQPARVLDLACGTGSIAERLLARFPEVSVTGVDLDPVTLAIATRGFAEDSRVEFLERDLRSAEWAEGLPAPFDAVLTATALHWLTPDELERLYADLAGLIRPGGVFANRDHFPLSDERLEALAFGLHNAYEERDIAEGAEHWDVWWERVAEDPELAPLVAERERRFGSSPDHETLHPFSWHAPRLCEAGFASADIVWRWGNDALLVGIR